MYKIGDIVKTNFMDIGIILKIKQANKITLYDVQSFFGDEYNQHTIMESQIKFKYDEKMYPEYYI